MECNLRFGIPSLDRLITGKGRSLADQLPSGIAVGERASASVSIVGPDGTGKSVLGLHLASRYVADCLESQSAPFVFYVSTDLSHEVAETRLWSAFRLDCPADREVPFARKCRYEGNPLLKVKLRPIDPLKSMAHYLLNGANREVGFVDFAKTTAGDDWGYVNRLLALLPQSEGPKHLMVIDSVEGFETLVGDKDAYGESKSRRARIAQLMRLAAGNCHLCLIVEERSPEERLPEVFVTDFVLRLREVEAHGYVRRAVQVEKARGYAHARGQHPFVIRDGTGSTTGEQPNVDDPKKPVCAASKGSSGKKEASIQKCQAYFHVFRSLHYLSRTTMQRSGDETPEPECGQYSGFGIRYLDDMLGGPPKTRRDPTKGRFDERGLPCHSVTALIGDSETQKTRLGWAFLAGCFKQYPRLLSAVHADLTVPVRRPDDLKRVLSWHLPWKISDPKMEKFVNEMVSSITRHDNQHLRKLLEQVSRLDHGDVLESLLNDTHFDANPVGGDYASPQLPLAVAGWLLNNRHYTNPTEGVAILLTTKDVDNRELARRFADFLRPPGGWEEPPRRVAERHFCDRTLCRRLEIHDLSSPIFMHIVESYVQEAQRRLAGGERANRTKERFKQSLGIRLVIDDFSVIKEIYPEIRSEQLLMPYLLFYLRREGITTLIINTHAQKPGRAGDDRFEQELRSLVDHRVYTWHVPFFGEDRVAIAAIPPLAENVGVRELEPGYPENPMALAVNPHFELYSGLEEGRPQPVSLEIRLYQETSAFEQYIKRENRFYKELFSPAPGCGEVVLGQAAGDYEVLRDLCSIQSPRQLNHTFLSQVDEFWSIGSPALRKQDWYLEAETVDEEGKRCEAEDPLFLFQESEGGVGRTGRESDRKKTPVKRRDLFVPSGWEWPSNMVATDRVPFTWDFGILLCREHCWTEAEDKKLTSNPKSTSVGDVWTRLRKVGDDGAGVSGQRSSAVTWREFLEACRIVAHTRSSRAIAPLPAFDLSLLALESFSCLVLEMWASEILQKRAPAENFAKWMSTRHWDQPRDLGKGADTTGDPAQEESLVTWLAGSQSQGDSIMKQYERLRRNQEELPSGSWIELYQAWLLLVEVLNLPEFVEPGRSLEFRPREPDRKAVAIRHWYKTAAVHSDEFDVSDPVTLCRLPGRFATRGDWFLAVFEGSRSDRLADQALDLLNSRRASVVRLQMGLGLPTRRTVAELGNDLMRVKLFKCGDKGELERVTYRDLRHIGSETRMDDFYWLWRSSLRDYDRHSRIWQRFLSRTMLFWNRLRVDLGRDWVSGFEIYDWIEKKDWKAVFRRNNKFGKSAELVSLKFFAKRCDFLLAELRDATLRRNESSRGPGL